MQLNMFVQRQNQLVQIMFVGDLMEPVNKFINIFVNLLKYLDILLRMLYIILGLIMLLLIIFLSSFSKESFKSLNNL
jgi:hypothetical protein